MQQMRKRIKMETWRLERKKRRGKIRDIRVREIGGTEGGSPRPAEREKRETSPPFIMRCVLLWHFPTLFYTHTLTVYIHVHTQHRWAYIHTAAEYVYMYILYITSISFSLSLYVCIYIYISIVAYIYIQSLQTWVVQVAGGRALYAMCIHSTITHFNRIIHQRLKRHHAVTSSLYHRRRVYDDQTIGFRWQIIAPDRFSKTAASAGAYIRIKQLAQKDLYIIYIWYSISIGRLIHTAVHQLER